MVYVTEPGISPGFTSCWMMDEPAPAVNPVTEPEVRAAVQEKVVPDWVDVS
jgi:hypothetical protein